MENNENEKNFKELGSKKLERIGDPTTDQGAPKKPPKPPKPPKNINAETENRPDTKQ
ncbi:hypothetical protein NIES4075_39910 [Tolypothrix sp. NIES-4075]|jgi:hypothetical protein|uniref:hypothetical protein n=1 Tax=Tolypothrix sp. NIES-4075 TaxID=2005459 RepID=UPI000B6F39DC|nr:hypothetical protein [Tolypothrix sp. NIES-4075]GAX42984.1 hypothetical protein NIES4075_39910 [Tolypothrix sp. NIES-4075]